MYSMRKIISFIFLSFLSIELYSQSQSINIPDFSPPETAELIKYIDHPVDLSYGLMGVDIPLYLIKEGDIEIPLVLKYHGSGLKVYEESGPVGMGWSLDFGPSLGRKINNAPDNYSYLNNPGYPKYNNSPNYYTYQLYPYLRSIANGAWDEYPDTFYYKLLSKSGKFMYNRGRSISFNREPEIVTIPFEPIKIAGDFTAFDIWDDDGCHYRFGYSLRDKNTYGLSKASSMMYTTSWKIQEVISPNMADTICFRYNPIEYVSHPYVLDDFVTVEDVVDGQGEIKASLFYSGVGDDLRFPFMTKGGVGGYGNIKVYNINSPRQYGDEQPKEPLEQIYCYSPPQYTVPTSGGESRENLLKYIESKTVLVEIHGISERLTKRNIERITVKDKATNKIIRTIEFTHTTFGTFSKGKLDRIKIYGENNELVETYSFDYYNPSYVPHPSSKASDCWGYSRGGSLSSTIPTQEISVLQHYNPWFGWGAPPIDIVVGDIGFDEGSGKASQDGLLKTITYPSGRRSTFYYEVNQRKDRDWNVIDTGGNRIRMIEEYDPISGNIITRTFKYGENEDGAGKIKYEMSAEDYMLEYFNYSFLNYGEGVGGTGRDGPITRVRIFSAAPLSNPFYQNGAIVHYEYVTEYVDSKGKTEYVFNESRSYSHHDIGTTLNRDSESEWSGGELLQKTEYRYDPKADYYYPIKRETNQYNRTLGPTKTIQYGMCYERLRKRTDESYTNEYETYIKYNGIEYVTGEIISGSKKLMQQKIETFDGDVSSTKTIVNSYDNPAHMYVTRQTTSDGYGHPLEITYKYAQDIQFQNANEESARKGLVNNNILSNVLLSESKQRNSKWFNKTTYNYVSNVNIPLAVSLSEGPASNQLRAKLFVDRFDAKGNPVQINDNVKSTVYLWGYGGHRLVAEIQNATYDEVKEKLGQALIDRLSNSLSLNQNDLSNLYNLRNWLPHALVTTIQYKSLTGISVITDPRGKHTYYYYDNAGRLNSIVDNDGNTLEEYKYNYSN